MYFLGTRVIENIILGNRIRGGAKLPSQTGICPPTMYFAKWETHLATSFERRTITASLYTKEPYDSSCYDLKKRSTNVIADRLWRLNGNRTHN